MAGLGSTLREEYQFYKMMDSLNVRLAANDKRRPDNPIGVVHSTPGCFAA